MELKAYEFKFLSECACCIRMPAYSDEFFSEDPTYRERVFQEEELEYIIAVNTFSSEDGLDYLEVRGVGKTFEDAVIVAINTLVLCELTSLNIQDFDDMPAQFFLENLIEKLEKLEMFKPKNPTAKKYSGRYIHIDKKKRPHWMRM